MKCPFRTMLTKKSVVDTNTFSPSYGKVIEEIEVTDFCSCIGRECPYHYYGTEIDTSSGYAQTKNVPRCKRAEM